MKKLLFFCTILFLTTGPGWSQSTITVDSTGEVMIPADIVKLQVQITVTGETAAAVFERHREQERFFAGVVSELDIREEDLVFQPMSIGPHQARQGREFRSRQHVELGLEDFRLFEELQVLLIDNGFESFSGRFSSSRQSEGEERALEEAIGNAREKAETIARSLGRRLGEVKSVEHTVYSAQPVYETRMTAAFEDAFAPSLMEFGQSIPVAASVRVIFRLEGAR